MKNEQKRRIQHETYGGNLDVRKVISGGLYNQQFNGHFMGISLRYGIKLV